MDLSQGTGNFDAGNEEEGGGEEEAAAAAAATPRLELEIRGW